MILKSLNRDLVAAWLQQMQAQLLLVHAQPIVNAAWFIHEWMAKLAQLLGSLAECLLQVS